MRFSVDLVGSQLELRFPYDPTMVDKIRNIPGATFNRTEKFWKVPSDLVDMVDFYCAGWYWSDAAREYFRVYSTKATEHRDLCNNLLLTLPALGLPFKVGNRTLYEHQVVGVHRILQEKKLLLADDMGLGKTTTALVGASLMGYPIHVICPSSLIAVWEMESAEVNVKIASISSWAKIKNITDEKFTLIVDEAHYAQNLKSNRTVKFLSAAWQATSLILLTGTPIKNGRPSNLFPLLLGLRHPLTYNKGHYEKFFCNAGPTRFSRWDVSGAANLLHLHECIKDMVLRRKKNDCLDLPTKTRVLRPVEFCKEAQVTFDLVFDTLQETYTKRVENGTIRPNDALVLLGQLRHAASWGKIETAVELADELIEEREQVVFFSSFVDSANALAVELRKIGTVGLLTGEVPVDQRTNAVASFQRGDLNFLVCTFGTGGLGITLTAGSTVILIDRPWTPGEAEQAEDRLYRIGQKNNVTAVWLQYPKTDIRVDELLQTKYRSITTVLEGQADSLNFESEALNIAKEIFAK